MRDDETGLTLEEKIAQGIVTIGPAVRIGRYCEIGPGVTISESNLDDDVDVRVGGGHPAVGDPRRRDHRHAARACATRSSGR